MPQARLAIFAKAPERGRVKTRLAASVGDDQALAVYRALLATTAGVAAAWDGPVTLHAAGDDQAWASTPLASLPRRPQCDGGLGERLAHGLSWELTQGSTALAIGTDCPLISVDALHSIAQGLQDAKVVFGPSTDGGYWCLGVRSHQAIATCCDQGLPWSSTELLAASQTACQRAGISHALGPILPDLDDEDDLRTAQAAGFDWQP